jgi:hypothetical protein
LNEAQPSLSLIDFSLNEWPCPESLLLPLAVRFSLIEPDQIEALKIGVAELELALREYLQDEIDPDVRVIRMAPEGYSPRWYLDVRAGSSRRIFIVDHTLIEVMRVIVPIYLIDLTDGVRAEMAGVFGVPNACDFKAPSPT